MPKVSRVKQKALFALLGDLSNATGHSKDDIREIIVKKHFIGTGEYIASFALDKLKDSQADDLIHLIMDLTFDLDIPDMRYSLNPI